MVAGSDPGERAAPCPAKRIDASGLTRFLDRGQVQAPASRRLKEGDMALTKKQLERRRSGIGASEIAAIAGESKWATPIQIYEAKVFGAELEETYQMDLGTELEAPIARVWAKREKRFIAPVDTLQHRTKQYALATPDRAVYLTQEARGDARKLKTDVRDAERLLQVKSSSWRMRRLWGDDGTDQIPAEYLCQAHWEGSVAGVDRVDFAVDFDKTQLHTFTVMVRPAIFDALYEIAERFMIDHVFARVAPPPDASERYREYLAKVFPTEKAETLVPIGPDDPLLVDLEYFARLKASAPAIKKLTRLLENRVKNRIGEATGVLGEFGKITWKRTRDGQTVDWQAAATEAVQLAGLVVQTLPEGAQRMALEGRLKSLIASHTSVRAGYRRLYYSWAPRLKADIENLEIKLQLLEQQLADGEFSETKLYFRKA
jgi:putative phage-type endonuclease